MRPLPRRIVDAARPPGSAGNIVEKVYESTAVSYVLATDVLGELESVFPFETAGQGMVWVLPGSDRRDRCRRGRYE